MNRSAVFLAFGASFVALGMAIGIDPSLAPTMPCLSASETSSCPEVLSLASERDEAAWGQLTDDDFVTPEAAKANAYSSPPATLTGHQKGAIRDDLLPNVADKKLAFAQDPKHGFSDADSDIFSKASSLLSILPDTQVYDAGSVEDQFCRRYAPKRWDIIEALPPVENQRSQGSCAAFATSYYGFHALVKWRYIVDLREKLKAKAPEAEVAAVRAKIGVVNKRFSPAYVYNQVNKGQDKGSAVGDAWKLIAATGCAQWDDMPYNDNDFRTRPSDAVKRRAAEWQGQIKRVWYIPRSCNLKVLKVFLSRGRPVIISLYVHKDFEGFKAPSREKAVYAPPREQTVDFKKEDGWHALCVFGFNDDREGGCFLLVNSWGLDWGYRGLAYVKYADFWNYVSHAYSVE
jgi:C1A family cysteine protease